MGNYTEGPWGINGNKMIVYKDEGDQLPIAVISTGTIHGAYDSDEYCANAHLIKTSPKLVEILKVLIHNHDRYDLIDESLWDWAKEIVAESEGVEIDA